MSLHDYARKRDFGATPEPQAAARRRGSKRQPIFVVQLIIRTLVKSIT